MADQDQTPTPGERIRIPVNADNAQDDQPGSERIERLSDEANASVDALIREYEEKYTGFRDTESDKIKRGASEIAEPRPRRYSVTNTNVSEDERMWAAISHGSAVLTLILGMLTGGLATLFTLFIPLGIYFAYRQRSQYVAYAALQAFALQVIGTVGWLAILMAGILVGALLCVVLAITLVGILLIPFVALAIVLFVAATFVLPLGMVVYGTIAAWETYQGKWYRYPWIADWIDRQMHTGFLATL
jgi:uncharacterized protein